MISYINRYNFDLYIPRVIYSYIYIYMDHSDEDAPMETAEETEEQRWVTFTEELFEEFCGDLSDDDRWRYAKVYIYTLIIYFWCIVVLVLIVLLALQAVL